MFSALAAVSDGNETDGVELLQLLAEREHALPSVGVLDFPTPHDPQCAMSCVDKHKVIARIDSFFNIGKLLCFSPIYSRF